MWTTNDYERVAQLVAAMIEKNWFDGAIGRVEAHNIFGGLMEHGSCGQILASNLV